MSDRACFLLQNQSSRLRMGKFRDEYEECWQRLVEERETACENTDSKMDGCIKQSDDGTAETRTEEAERR